MDGSTSNRKRQLITTLAVLIIIVVIVAAAVVTSKKDTPTSTVDSTGDTAATTMSDDTNSSNSTYNDGTYSAVGGYNSPGGAETITISLTLKDNAITGTSAKPGATNTEAEEHQADFIAAYEDLVVGKDINQVELSRVAGSSLTTIGFNNAIEQIKNKAER